MQKSAVRLRTSYNMYGIIYWTFCVNHLWCRGIPRSSCNCDTGKKHKALCDFYVNTRLENFIRLKTTGAKWNSFGIISPTVIMISACGMHVTRTKDFLFTSNTTHYYYYWFHEIEGKDSRKKAGIFTSFFYMDFLSLVGGQSTNFLPFV